LFISGTAELPDGIFSNQNTDLGKYRRVLQWKMYVIWLFGLFHGFLLDSKAIWYILSPFGILHIAPRQIWQPWNGLAEDSSASRVSRFGANLSSCEDVEKSFRLRSLVFFPPPNLQHLKPDLNSFRVFKESNKMKCCPVAE
jgi:hypothetical protein